MIKDDSNCIQCNSLLNVPVKLSCDHHYCFLCLCMNLLKNNFYCIGCNNNLTISEPTKLNDQEKKIIKYLDNHYLWLYSSNFTSTWWCYEKPLNQSIEHIYEDYLFIKKNKDDRQNDKSNPKITIQKSKNANDILNHTNTNYTYDDIEISDNDSSLEVSFSDESNDEIYNKKHDKPQLLSYVVNAAGSEYKMDFDLMKQINTADSNKSRKIKRLEIPSDIVNDGFLGVLLFLKENDVIGISGYKFSHLKS